MAVRFTPLDAPKLYPDDPRAILRAIYDKIFSASDGTLNDFTPHSPIAALCEGELYAILELLYYTNKLPDALGIAFLKIAGIQRRLGQAATVTLTFTLTAPLGTPFTLSAGYIVKSRSNLEFATDSTLTIPAGQISGTVTATSSAILGGIRQTALGSAYNVPAYTIDRLTESRAFLRGVTNTEPATGGLDAETLDEARSRGFAALRRRSVLVSGDDYEQFAREYLGAGSVSKAIGRLGSDRTSLVDGAVHVFVLGNDGRTPPNFTQQQELRSALAVRSPVGLQNLVSVSPIELLQLQVQVVAVLVPGSNPQAVSGRILNNLDRYFTPGTSAIGKSVLIKEVERVVRNSGVETVQSVSFLVALNGGTTILTYNGNVPVANQWTAPILFDLNVTLVDETNDQSYLYSYGAGGDLD